MAVVVISVIVDMQSPGNDFNNDPGCHIDWFGIVPVGQYCGFP